VPSADAGKRNPLARQRAHVLGHASAPKWQIVEMLLGIGVTRNSTLMVGCTSKRISHPDQIPLLALRQVDDE
jgi:hypothetical protein